MRLDCTPATLQHDISRLIMHYRDWRRAMPALCDRAESNLRLCHNAMAPFLRMQSRNRRNGAIALGVVSLLIVWFFSVPPDIRRANVCVSSSVSSDQYSDDFLYAAKPGSSSAIDSSRDCIKAEALWGRVLQHYQSCGAADGQAACVQFDVSIDPRSRESFSQSMKAAREQFR